MDRCLRESTDTFRVGPVTNLIMVLIEGSMASKHPNVLAVEGYPGQVTVKFREEGLKDPICGKVVIFRDKLLVEELIEMLDNFLEGHGKRRSKSVCRLFDKHINIGVETSFGLDPREREGVATLFGHMKKTVNVIKKRTCRFRSRESQKSRQRVSSKEEVVISSPCVSVSKSKMNSRHLTLVRVAPGRKLDNAVVKDKRALREVDDVCSLCKFQGG